MKSFNTSSFWGMISGFYDNLKQSTRERYESLWEGVSVIASEMIRSVSRYMLTTDPTQVPTQPQMGIYGVAIDITQSLPYNIDQTDPNSRSAFVPKQILANPTPSGRQDQFVVEKNVYDAFSSLSQAKYIIVNDGSTTRYFLIQGMSSPTANTYVIQAYANTSYIAATAKVTFSISSGCIYAVDPYIISLPYLKTNIMDDTAPARKFVSGTDYVFSKGRVEFINDVVADGAVENGQSLFCENVDVMEFNLFNTWGSLTGLRDWVGLGLDNISAKAANTVLMQGLQNPANVVAFEKAMSVLMGLQLSPQKGQVVGVFEEYDYVVTSISGDTVYFRINDSNPLHEFIQIGTKFIVDGTTAIVNVSALDRALWSVTIDDVSAISVGSALNVQLLQRLPLLAVTKPNLNNSYFTVAYHTEFGDIQHIIDVMMPDSAPVFFIGGNSGYDGLYHAYTTAFDGINHNISIFDEWAAGDTPLYNDFVVDAESLSKTTISGYLHLPWPTCKYVLIRFQDQTLYKVFVDSKIDTVLDSGDAVEQFQPICRSLRVCDEREFPMWNEYDGFRMQNGIDLLLNALELVWTIPGAKTGINFPN